MGYTVYYQDGVQGNWDNYLKDMRRVMNTFLIPEFKPEFTPGNNTGDLSDNDWDSIDTITNSSDPYKSSAHQNCAFYVDEGHKSFNLYGPHESFNFKSQYPGEFTFTKTARKSYDGLIKVCYLVTQKHYEGEISHDGDIENFLTECLDRITPEDQGYMQECLFNLELLNDHVIKWVEPYINASNYLEV